MTVLAVDAELAALRARVAALEELAKFFLRKSEGWGVSRNDPPGTPAFARGSGPHVTWGAASEQAKVKDSSGLDRVVDEWIRFQGDVQGAGR